MHCQGVRRILCERTQLILDHYRSGYSLDVREGFIVMVKALISHLCIGFALVYPFIHL